MIVVEYRVLAHGSDHHLNLVGIVRPTTALLDYSDCKNSFDSSHA